MTNEFTWHEVKEEEKKEIEKKAKIIMDSFSKKIEKIDISKKNKEEETDSRRKNYEDSAKINREIMFSNAREKNKDFIIAEKKKW